VKNVLAEGEQTPLPRFISCSKTLLDEDENLPNLRTKKGFDLNAYKLTEKAGFDFNNPVPSRKVVDVETYGLQTQNKIQEQGVIVKVSKVSLS